MSRIRANSITNAEGTGAPQFPNGLSVTGVITATSFGGNVTGNATGLSGTPNITVGVATATEFDISGSSNSLTAGGLNVGVVTATRLIVGSAVTITTNGLNTVGIITANDYDGNFILDSYLFN